MLMKSSMKAMPLAAAMTAALVFGAAAHAQSGTAATSNAPTGIGGTTKAQDAIINPAPTADKGRVARPVDTDSSPNPEASKALTAQERADRKAARVAKRAEGKGKVARPVDTDSSPNPEASKALTAQERDDRKAARNAKRAERRSKDATGDLGATMKLDPSK